MNTTDTNQIANNIRAERSRANITIDEIIKILDISKPTYIEYEKNAEKVRLETLIQLSKIFKCNIEDFFVTR